MFKRITWMGIGMAVGATGAFRAKRKVERAVERYLPEQVADRAAASARTLGESVRAAAQEGRAAMRATELELRSRVEARTYVGDRPDPRDRPSGDDGTTRLRPESVPGPRRASRASRGAPSTPGARRRSRR